MSSNERGKVFWLTGLSGVGKTTVGRQLHQFLKDTLPTVYLDGDELRALFDIGPTSYTLEERKQVAHRNGRLCKFLSDQGIHVVCATISLFHACQKWNRENITNYHEIWIRSPLSILEKRDPKGIYKRAKEGKISNVAGLDLNVEFPEKPDLILENDGLVSPEDLLQSILTKFDLLAPSHPYKSTQSKV